MSFRRHPILSLWALLVAGCTPPPPPPPPPAPAPVPVEDVPEVTSEGDAAVTVLSRPDHPAVRSDAPGPATPMTDGQCRARQACGSEGKCTAAGTACIVGSYADCEQMAACALGKCTFTAGSCKVVSSCRDSWGCAQEGLCAELDGRCAAADADGCQASAACRQDGRCTVDDGLCVAKYPKDCASAHACTYEGRCEVDAGACVVSTDGQCRRSAACREGKRCLARDGVCVESCEASDLCTRFGRCHEKKGKAGMTCAAVRDVECKKAGICDELGHCSVSVDGRCEAGDDVECRRSRACREDGRCTAQHGRCLPASDAECKQSMVACGREARCRMQDGRCVR